MRGPQPEKVPEKPVTEETTMLILRPPPPPAPAILPTEANAEPVTTVALVGSPGDPTAQAADGSTTVPPAGSSDPTQPDATGAQPTGAEQASAAPPTAASSLFVGTLTDPAEEAAKAAAAAEVQAQQEATMAALDEAKATSVSHTAASPVAQVWDLVYEYCRVERFLSSLFLTAGESWRICQKGHLFPRS